MNEDWREHAGMDIAQGLDRAALVEMDRVHRVVKAMGDLTVAMRPLLRALAEQYSKIADVYAQLPEPVRTAFERKERHLKRYQRMMARRR